jgi:hypothetical protein
MKDVRDGARMLRRQPGFTITAVLSLTLGIAASTIIFTFVKAVFMPALPVQDPSRLVLISSTTRGKSGTNHTTTISTTMVMSASRMNRIRHRMDAHHRVRPEVLLTLT